MKVLVFSLSKLSTLFVMLIGLLLAVGSIPSVPAADTREFIDPPFLISTDGPQCAYPATACDTRHHRYLVVWQQAVGSDVEIIGRFMDVDGGPSDCHSEPFNISLDAAAPDFSPAVSFDPTSERFLIVWETRGAPREGSNDFDSTIHGRFVGGLDDCAVLTPSGSPLAISSPGDIITQAPSVAVGTMAGGLNCFLVVYLQATSDAQQADVYGQLLSSDGLMCGDPVVIGEAGGLDPRFHPAVAFGEPDLVEYFSVVYRTSDQALRIARVTPTCGNPSISQKVLARDIADGPADQGVSPTDVSPAITYNRIGHHWLVNWIDYSTKLGAVLKWMPVSASYADSYVFTTPLGPFRFVRGLSSTASMQTWDFAVALGIGRSRSSGYDVWLFEIDFEARFFSGGPVAGGSEPDEMNDGYPAVVANPQQAGYLVAWQRQWPNGLSDIVARKYVP